MKVKKEDILAGTVRVAERLGYAGFIRDDVAEELSISGPAIQYHFGTMKKLRSELMRYAVKNECLRVIAQGVAAGDRQAMKACPELQARAFESLVS